MSQSDQSDPLNLLPPAGRASRTIREVRGLVSDPSERRRRSVLIAEGIHLAEEALRTPGRVRLALASPRLLRTAEGRAVAARLGAGAVESRRLDDDLLARLCQAGSHQGILLVVDHPHHAAADLTRSPDPPLVLVACGVQDPGNLGALARVAEAAWASGLACAGGADPWSARSVRASAGSLLRLPVAEFADPPEAASQLHSLGLRRLGATPRAAQGYREAELQGPMALFVGGEGAGLDPATEAAMDDRVRIPMKEGVESLNVAAAAAVLLFEAAGRRRRP